ncbi:unnamed protein product [Medioppia subpectinata]|uniref:Nuclear receptor domain-containing protein n=1 Tax=Medioppia subpectinata TaxID=1979941 RepID=A0A7R9KJS9_9ACAR|nr:unnamed protein product [Medioppia subpectinata]CAG2104833.1 unnamed protein product [Medioppia subpectinata]
MCHQSYGAFTCDPCRVFFSRNATETQALVCRFDDIESTSCRDSTLKSKGDLMCLYGNDGSDNIGIKQISIALRGTRSLGPRLKSIQGPKR